MLIFFFLGGGVFSTGKKRSSKVAKQEKGNDETCSLVRNKKCNCIEAYLVSLATKTVAGAVMSTCASFTTVFTVHSRFSSL